MFDQIVSSIFGVPSQLVNGVSYIASSIFGGKGDDLTDALDPGFGDSTAENFLKMGVKAFGETMGGDKTGPFSAPERAAVRPRGVAELTRGSAAGSPIMGDISQRMYSNDAVASAYQRLMSSNNQQVRDLFAAAGVDRVKQTVGSGRKTASLSSPSLKSEVDVI
jgi:hypothetical protein